MKKTLLILALALSFSLFSCSQKTSTTEAVPSVIADAPLEYVLEDLSGTVMVLTAGDTQPEAAQEEQTVQAGDEIITQAGSEVSLTLNPATMTHLSENSDVKVGQLIRNTTDGFTSRLSLVSGKLLSEVEKLVESKSVFEVEAGGAVCGVRGTAFEVDKEGDDVQTSTFHGVVEVKKDSDSQTVEADQHCDFLLSQNTFQPKRALTGGEKERYQAWQPKMTQLRQKIEERWTRLRALDRLPAGEKQKILQQLNGVRGKDRLKMLHQAVRESRQRPQNQNSGAEQKPPMNEPATEKAQAVHPPEPAAQQRAPSQPVNPQPVYPRPRGR